MDQADQHWRITKLLFVAEVARIWHCCAAKRAKVWRHRLQTTLDQTALAQ
jgi:hypothetical protein